MKTNISNQLEQYAYLERVDYNKDISYYRLNLSSNGGVVDCKDIEFENVSRYLLQDDDDDKNDNKNYEKKKSDKNCKGHGRKIQDVLLSSEYLETLSTAQAAILIERISKLSNLYSFELNYHHLHTGGRLWNNNNDNASVLSMAQQAVFENVLFGNHYRNNATPARLTRLKLWNIQIDTNQQASLLARAIQGLIGLDDFCINVQQGQNVALNGTNHSFERFLFHALSTLPFLRKVFVGMGCRGFQQRHQQHQHQHQQQQEMRTCNSHESLRDLCLSPSLQALGLDQVTLDASHIASIAQALQINSNDNDGPLIRVLSLWNTSNLCKASIGEIGRMLRVNTSLHWLTLKNVGLDDTSCLLIAKALEENTVLEELVISQNNRISARGYHAFIDMLRTYRNTALKSIVTDYAAQNDDDDDIQNLLDFYCALDRKILCEYDTVQHEQWIIALADAAQQQQQSLSTFFHLLCAYPSICCCRL